MISKIISNEFGSVLVFDTKQDLENVIKHLQGQLDWINEQEASHINDPVKPPYLYGTFADEQDPEKLQQYMSHIKATVNIDFSKLKEE